MRHLPLLFAALALAGCASVPETPPPPSGQEGPQWSAEETRALVERDVGALLGAEALAEARRTETSVLVRQPVSFPRMIRQPDGSYLAEPPQVAAAVRTAHGWIGWHRSRRFGFDAYASRELDRLAASGALWAEPELVEAGCTDAAGPSSVLRHRGRMRVATQPCGASGLTGRLTSIALAGRVTDWSAVAPIHQPDGIEIRRFHPQTEQYFQFAGGLREPLNLVVRDPRTWEAMWRRITANHGEPPPPPEALFDREMLLIAAMGSQPSGGYRIRIERVLDEGDALEVHVVHTSPGPRCGALAVITLPVDVVRVAASDEPVRWLIRRDVADCP